VAVNSRRRVLIAIISVVVLLLAVQLAGRFGSDTVENRAASASAETATPTTNDVSSKQAVKPSVDTTGPENASSPPAIVQPPLSANPGRENDAAAGSPGVEGFATPAPHPPQRQRRARPGTVAAECWGLRGSERYDYVVTLDREVHTSGEASAFISSLRDSPGYTTMFQTSAAGPVRGKRVEFSADVRTRGSTRGANLLLRAEDAYGNTVAFDNMTTSYGAERRPDQLINRGVKGDTEWSTQHVVVDIPDEARVITYGLSLFGGGKAWIDNARLEVVTTDMETTAVDVPQLPTAPLNIPVRPESLTRSPRNLEFDLEAQAGAAPCN